MGVKLRCFSFLIGLSLVLPLSLLGQSEWQRQMQKAEALYGEGQDQPAIQLLRPLTQANPKLGEAWELLGLCYFRQEQFAEAVSALRFAVELLPKAVRPQQHLAKALLERARLEGGDRRESEVAFRRFAELAPTEPEAWFGLYESSREPLERQRAMAALDKLPDSVERRMLRGWAARAAGRHREAIAEWRAGLAMQQGRLDLQQELARSLYDNRSADDGQRAEAERLVRKLLTVQPANGALHYLLGLCRMEDGDPAGAAKALGRAHRLQPSDLPTRAALGRALLATKRAALAVPHLEAAAGLDRDGSLHMGLHEAYLALGLVTKAEEARRKAEALRRASMR